MIKNKPKFNINRIVLTGGPCAGKTSIIRELEKVYEKRIHVVPEAACVLFDKGFPMPGRDVEWSPRWQEEFQYAVKDMQIMLEEEALRAVKQYKKNIIVLDRGVLDGAAYLTNGDAKVYCEKVGIDFKNALERYDKIIHIESLAATDPEKYEQDNYRFESIERALEIEQGLKEAWKHHSQRMLISGDSIEFKTEEVVSAIENLRKTFRPNLLTNNN